MLSGILTFNGKNAELAWLTVKGVGYVWLYYELYR